MFAPVAEREQNRARLAATRLRKKLAASPSIAAAIPKIKCLLCDALVPKGQYKQHIDDDELQRR